ncbi:MAG: hypothetical protein ACP5IA_01905 [Sediminispirochaetaceae bacterium]
MKKTVAPALTYIVFYILTLCIVTGIVILYQSVLGYAPGIDSEQALVGLLPGILTYMIPVATIASLVLVLLVHPHNPVRNILSSLLIAIAAVSLYAGPAYFLLKLQPAMPELTRFPLYEGRLTQQGDTMIFNEKITARGEGSIDSIEIENLAIIHLQGEGPRIKFLPKVTTTPDTGTLTTPRGEQVLDYSSSQTPIEAIVSPSKPLRQFAVEVRSLSRSLQDSFQRGLIPFLLLITAHVLFMTGAWAVIRTSRWPLWNGLLSLIFFRGFFYLDSLFRGEAVREGLKILALQDFIHLAPAAGFLFFFALFLLWGIFFLKPGNSREAGI